MTKFRQIHTIYLDQKFKLKNAILDYNSIERLNNMVRMNFIPQ